MFFFLLEKKELVNVFLNVFVKNSLISFIKENKITIRK